ncbi:MAG: hypothetical protein WD035_01650 [Balneolaceae bacterium]
MPTGPRRLAESFLPSGFFKKQVRSLSYALVFCIARQQNLFDNPHIVLLARHWWDKSYKVRGHKREYGSVTGPL